MYPKVTPVTAPGPRIGPPAGAIKPAPGSRAAR